MSDWFVESANHTCGSFPADVDEMAAAGLTAVPSMHVAPPRVQESAISMECKVRLNLKEHTQGTEKDTRGALSNNGKRRWQLRDFKELAGCLACQTKSFLV